LGDNGNYNIQDVLGGKLIDEKSGT